MVKGAAEVKSTDKLAQLLARYWRGEEPLWAQFWLYGMVGGTILGTVNTYFSQLFLSFMYRAFSRGNPIEMMFYIWPVVTLFGFWWTYYVWHVVSVWRCARNARHPIIGWLARIFVVLVTVGYWGVYTLFVLEGY